MLFSATLDAGVRTLVTQFLHKPVTHEADSAHSPVSAMDHHVLRIEASARTQVVAELAAAPGNTIVFTRTKYGAKKLAKQLLALGVPAVELHGNLSQNARTRNLDAFHSGRVRTLVATDIAARGIHVDDVGLVVHADPPSEHKAYLHRSGRTARAGASGTVITLELPEQRGDVRSLLRQAKIRPTFTSAAPGAPILAELAPGEREFLTPAEAAQRAGVQPRQPQPAGKSGGQSGRNRGPRSRGKGGAAGRNRGERPGGSRRSRNRGAQPARAGSAPRTAADFSRSIG